MKAETTEMAVVVEARTLICGLRNIVSECTDPHDFKWLGGYFSGEDAQTLRRIANTIDMMIQAAMNEAGPPPDLLTFEDG